MATSYFVKTKRPDCGEKDVGMVLYHISSTCAGPTGMCVPLAMIWLLDGVHFPLIVVLHFLDYTSFRAVSVTAIERSREGHV